MIRGLSSVFLTVLTCAKNEKPKVELINQVLMLPLQFYAVTLTLTNSLPAKLFKKGLKYFLTLNTPQIKEINTSKALKEKRQCARVVRQLSPVLWFLKDQRSAIFASVLKQQR